MKRIIITLLMACFLGPGLNSAWAVTVSVRVTGSSNDAEEQNPPNTTMYLNSSDLELGYDGGMRQFVGMRFQSLSIPQGATINSAYIEFEVDEADSGTTNVIIFGEDIDDAVIFGNSADNISNRTRTAASVNWSIPAWPSLNAKQQTPDISTIVQQIINRGGWNSGNDLVVIIEPGAGCSSTTCQRTAESVNGEPANAPLLVVDYTVGPVTPYAWFQLDALSGSWNGSVGEVIDQLGNVTGAFAIGTGSGVDTVAAQVCNGVDIPANNSNAAQYGIDSSIDMDSDLGDTGTISFWYNSNADWSGGGDRMLVDASTTADNKYFFLALMNSGSLRFRFEDSSDGDFQLDAVAQSFSAGSWHHIAITWDLPNDSMEVFIDGNSVGTNNGNTTGSFGSLGTVYFGDNRSTYHPSGTANSANGIIDEIRLYSSVQSAGDITGDMNATHVCPMQPLAEWRFDECSYSGVAGEVIDTQGAYHATPFNGVNTNTPGLLGNYLDGTSNTHQARAVTTVPMQTTWTVSAWFQTPIVTTQQYHVLGAMNGGGDLIFLDRNQNFRWGVYTPGGDVQNGSFRFGTLSSGWHHIGLVGNDQGANGQTLLYIDGVFVETVNLQAQGNLQYIGTSFDGANGGSAQGFGTALDEFIVFDEAFSATQISSIYSHQLAGNNFDGTARIPPSCGAVDHYDISHSGLGVTCEAESITITAHDAAHSPMAPASSTTITLTTSIANDGWALETGNGTFIAPNQYTFDGAENFVEFWLTKTAATVAPHMDIDVTDGTATELGSEDPVLEFRDTALRFYADSNYNTIGTQVAGKSSNVAPGNQVLTLRAVQTNTDTGACEARISGAQTVQMAFECVNPATCKTANGVLITDDTLSTATAIADNPFASISSYANVDLTFDANGEASWAMGYLDAGQIALHANLVIPASGNDPADTLAGSSNIFTVVPAGLCVSSPDANADCASGDVSCSAFMRAGEVFNLAVKAVGWEMAAEANTDFCSGNATTPNFQLAGITIGHNPVAPATIFTGLLGTGSLDINSTDDGEGNIASQTISEVGVFSFTASAPTYFTETIAASTSANIGRFYPDHFSLTANPVTNRIALGGGGIFTYMDEDFQLSYTLTAENSTNGVTQNYSTAAGFALLNTAAELNYASVDITLPTNLSGRLATTTPAINWVAGNLIITDSARISRNAIPDGPYLLVDVGVAPTDEDGVLLGSYDLDINADSTNDHTVVATTQIRFGRMALNNTFGSELVTLNMPMNAEYFNGSNFIVNTDDNLTPLSTTELILSNLLEGGQTDGDIQLLAAQVSQASIANNPLLSGNAGLTFCPPGNPACTPTSGNEGFIDVQIDLSLFPYLRFDWDGDGNQDNDPTARATFGIYSGDSKQIYYRQIYR